MSRVRLIAELRDPCALRNPSAVFDLRGDEIRIRTDLFLGRVLFRIDGVHVGPMSWSKVPVLGFALDLKVIVNRLAKPGSYVLSTMSREPICLTREEGADSVVVQRKKESVAADYDALLDAADHFLQDLLDDLSYTFPQLTENPAYPKWRAL